MALVWGLLLMDGAGIAGETPPTQPSRLQQLLEESREHLADRQQQIRRLIDQLRADPEPDQKAIIIDTLGALRADDAAAKLAHHLTLSWSEPSQIVPSLAGTHEPRYPAMDALVAMGGVALPEMVRMLEESDDQAERRMALLVMLFVLQGIETPQDGVIALRQMIDRAIQRQTDPAKQHRLIDAREAIGGGP